MQRSQTSVVNAVNIVMKFIAMIAVSHSALGYQSFTNLPGSRAAGMAGVFTAQADDATAIWYNPSGLSRPGLDSSEASIDWGDLVGRDEQGDISADDSSIKFAGVHIARLPDLSPLIQRPALGIALLRPYNVDVDITEPRSALDPTPFGRVAIDYAQASFQASMGLGKHAAIGATYDLLWSDVACLSFSPCADDGPSGNGFTVAVSYYLPISDLLELSGTLVARNKAAMDYDRVASSGIGRLLDDYAPDRPASINAGANIRATTSWGVANANIDVAQINWSDSVDGAIEFDPDGMDYTRIGLGTEIILPMASASLALRAGYATETPENTKRFAEIDHWTLGVGLAINTRHFLDGALQWRDISENANSDTQQFLSLSYSLQF